MADCIGGCLTKVTQIRATLKCAHIVCDACSLEPKYKRGLFFICPDPACQVSTKIVWEQEAREALQNQPAQANPPPITPTRTDSLLEQLAFEKCQNQKCEKFCLPKSIKTFGCGDKICRSCITQMVDWAAKDSSIQLSCPACDEYTLTPDDFEAVKIGVTPQNCDEFQFNQPDFRNYMREIRKTLPHPFNQCLIFERFVNDKNVYRYDDIEVDLVKSILGITDDLQQLSEDDQVAIRFRQKCNLEFCMVCKHLKATREIFEEGGCHLPCEHYVCSRGCMVNLVNGTVNRNYSLFDQVLCQLCDTQVEQQCIFSAFGGQERFNKLIEEFFANEDLNPAFNCNICFDEVSQDEIRTLMCDHRFCQYCIEGHITMLINERKISEDQLICPQRNCGEPIKAQMIYDIVPNELYEKYNNWSMLDNPLNEIEVIKKCANPNCDYVMVINREAKVFECPKEGCGWVFCPQCDQQHDEEITCADFADQQMDQEVRALLKAGGARQCPHCASMIDKVDGCNFITCDSKDCRGQKYFCYICECVLGTHQHYSHFTNGPFNWQCHTYPNGRPDNA